MWRARYIVRPVRNRRLALLGIVCICIAIFAAIRFAQESGPYREAAHKYEKLRLEFGPFEKATPAVTGIVTQAPIAGIDPIDINSDYAGWLSIEGTEIDYPVVQAEDNEKYLHTTFSGEENKLGAIFLDARCAGFEAPHVILYGHNAKDGSMFGSLSRYLDSGFEEQHPSITVTLPGGSTQVYRVFSARETDTGDLAYQCELEDAEAFATLAERLGAPEDTARILTLSTCRSGGIEKRLLVHAAQIQERQ